MAGTLRVTVDVRGAREVERALGKVPEDGRKALVKRSNELAYNLLRRMRRAAASDSRVAAAAARTLKVERGSFLPSVVAGPEKRLFGSEFGAHLRFGWYKHPRYQRSRGRQYKRHRGGASYWFHSTREKAQPTIDAAWQKAADDVIRSWSA